MSPKRPELDDNATFVGILLGIVLGALYALLHIKHRGSVRRKDLTRFGAGSVEAEIEASLEEAKRMAKSRLAEES
jgi:gas vesicle protein